LVEEVHKTQELVTMKATSRLRPQQSAPVERVNVGNKTDLLAELSEESLTGIVASVTVECIRVCICAASGADGK
jgi:hypothetical protein